MNVTIATSETRITVDSPYNTMFAPGAREIGGKWDG